MNEARALQEQYDALLARFVRPLLEGGTARVGDPIAPAALAHFEMASCSDTEVEHAIADALASHVGELLPARRLPWPERGAIALACALHDLAFVSDPSLDRLFARGARRIVAQWVAAHAANAGLPRSRGQVLVRHALAERFLALRRRDVVVSNWAYTWRFHGRPVPPKYLSWKAIRRVRTRQSTLDLAAVLAAAPAELDLPNLAGAVLARSPLTPLLATPGAPPPSFDLAAAAVLSDRALRGAVVRAHAADPIRAARLFGRVLSTALVLPPAAAGAVVVFLHELQVACLLARDPTAPPVEDAATAGLAALLPACALTEAGRALVGFDALDPRDARRVVLAAQRISSQLPAQAAALARSLLAHATGADAHRLAVCADAFPYDRPEVCP
jgi:hypothetical protein